MNLNSKNIPRLKNSIFFCHKILIIVPKNDGPTGWPTGLITTVCDKNVIFYYAIIKNKQKSVAFPTTKTNF